MSAERPEPGSGLAPRAALTSRRALADEVSDLFAREYILSEVVAPGELLPSEAKLAERYGVSRVTTRASLRSLREAGLISIRHGVGSVVLPRSDVLRYGLDRLSSFETFAREAGRDIQTDSLAIEESVADADMARALAIPVGAPIFVVPRTKIYKGTPVAWLVDHFPRDLLPRDVMRAEFTGSVLDVFLAHDELHVDYAECEIEPVAFSEEIAGRLGVEPGTVGLFMDEFVYTAEGKPVARCLGWHRHDHSYRRFWVRRRRQVGD
jgi:GntR family transcriptional regulator